MSKTILHNGQEPLTTNGIIAALATASSSDICVFWGRFLIRLRRIWNVLFLHPTMNFNLEKFRNLSNLERMRENQKETTTNRKSRLCAWSQIVLLFVRPGKVSSFASCLLCVWSAFSASTKQSVLLWCLVYIKFKAKMECLKRTVGDYCCCCCFLEGLWFGINCSVELSCFLDACLQIKLKTTQTRSSRSKGQLFRANISSIHKQYKLPDAKKWPLLLALDPTHTAD